MKFRDEAIKNNVEIALLHVTHDMAAGQWFDASWVSYKAYELGHSITESFAEHWLIEKAIEGMYERDGGFFKAL